MTPQTILNLAAVGEDDKAPFDLTDLTVKQQETLSQLIKGEGSKHVGDASRVASSDVKPSGMDFYKQDIVKKAFNENLPFTPQMDNQEILDKAIDAAIADKKLSVAKLNEGGIVGDSSFLRGEWRKKEAARLMDELGINAALKGMKITQEPKREKVPGQLGGTGPLVPRGGRLPWEPPEMIDVHPDQSDKIMGMVKNY